MKKISFILLVILGLNLYCITFASENISHTVSFSACVGNIEADNIVPGEEVLAVVYTAHGDWSNTEDSEVVYYNIMSADENGKVKFSFNTGEKRGHFCYYIGYMDGTYEEKGCFEFDPSYDNEIRSFFLSNIPCSIIGDKISLKVSSDTNISGLIAEFTVQEDALVYVGEKLQKSGITRNDFSSPVIYTVISEAGTEKVYTVTVTKEQPVYTGTSGASGGGTGSIISATYKKEDEEKENNIKEENIINAREELFRDVNPKHWAAKPIDFMIEREIISGYEDGNFRPSANITRAEFVKIIVKAFTVVPGVKEIILNDVSEEDWFAYYVNLAASNGIVNGDLNKNFNPYSPISREDMAVILKRVTDLSGISLEIGETNQFNDFQDISLYAKDPLSKLNGAGIISGYPDNTLRPKANATRAEACAVIFKILNK